MESKPNLPRAIAEAIAEKEQLDLGDLAGEGAFKHTFKATSSDGSPVCLKLFKEGKYSPRSDRELGALRMCDHEGIAKLISVGEIVRDGKKTTYYLEEYIPGGSLQDKLSKCLLSPEETASIARLLSGTLQETARLRLVHRDIKPANIMLREDGRPVLVDFGLVRVLDQSSLTGTWHDRGPGTPFYAAPEQLNNEKDLIDWRTDQFGLGVTISMVGMGVHPYALENEDASLAVEHVAQRSGPSELWKIAVAAGPLKPIGRMVEAWPVQRFRQPGELKDAWIDVG